MLPGSLRLVETESQYLPQAAWPPPPADPRHPDEEHNQLSGTARIAAADGLGPAEGGADDDGPPEPGPTDAGTIEAPAALIARR
jgi:hypothetical protein